MHKSLDIDFRAVESRLRGRDFVRSSEMLGPTDTIFKTREHGYRRVDDGAFLHVMDFEAGPTYSLKIARPDYVCIQISVSGTYNRWISDHVDPVKPATIDITNTPLSVSDTQAGTRLSGILIACDREYLVDHFKLNVDRLPAVYRPIFGSAAGKIRRHGSRGPDIVLQVPRAIATSLFERKGRRNHLRSRSADQWFGAANAPLACDAKQESGD
jgi:AraC family transcriptional activator of pyochelin receptor